MKVVFGCDPNAQSMKESLMKYCTGLGFEVIDLGSEDPIYANTAFKVCDFILSGKADRGVLICGTGLGMSIAANKVKGIYAALLTDVYSAGKAQTSNNTNVACFGAFTIGEKLAEELLTVWLNKDFDKNSPSQPKVQAIDDYQKSH